MKSSHKFDCTNSIKPSVVIWSLYLMILPLLISLIVGTPLTSPKIFKILPTFLPFSGFSLLAVHDEFIPYIPTALLSPCFSAYFANSSKTGANFLDHPH